ncbi:MAG: hypothetical protein N2747_05145 [Chitinophagaceae bacterium]|nr:hypothetical protein [Chitinophagaceae bacterium]
MLRVLVFHVILSEIFYLSLFMPISDTEDEGLHRPQGFPPYLSGERQRYRTSKNRFRCGTLPMNEVFAAGSL